MSTRANTTKIGRNEADKLFHAIMQTKIGPPATDCISPIGEDLMLTGCITSCRANSTPLATRPPAVYRGNPFLIEVGLAYGGMSAANRVPLEVLGELLEESDARTLRQFLSTTFDGLGRDAADKIIKEAGLGHAFRQASSRRPRSPSCTRRCAT